MLPAFLCAPPHPATQPPAALTLQRVDVLHLCLSYTNGAAGKVQAQAFFYIIDRKVYQAPSLHAAITTRLQRCLYNIQQAFDKLQVLAPPQAAPACLTPAAACDDARLHHQLAHC